MFGNNFIEIAIIIIFYFFVILIKLHFVKLTNEYLFCCICDLQGTVGLIFKQTF